MAIDVGKIDGSHFLERVGLLEDSALELIVGGRLHVVGVAQGAYVAAESLRRRPVVEVIHGVD